MLYFTVNLMLVKKVWFHYMICTYADEHMTSSDAAAALGLQSTSRLKQKVESSCCMLVTQRKFGRILQYQNDIDPVQWYVARQLRLHFDPQTCLSLSTTFATTACCLLPTRCDLASSCDLVVVNTDLYFVISCSLCLMCAQGKLDAVAAAMLLTAYFERPEGAIRVKSIKHR